MNEVVHDSSREVSKEGPEELDAEVERKYIHAYIK